MDWTFRITVQNSGGAFILPFCFQGGLKRAFINSGGAFHCFIFSGGLFFGSKVDMESSRKKSGGHA